MTKKVAVLQSNYIPWKGYFDIINDVDLFIFYDDVQYTKNDWRNRNKVKTPQGTQWITIPVSASSEALIHEAGFQNLQWTSKHYKTLAALYSKAPYFKKYKEFLEYVYVERKWESLSELNQYLITYISHEFLGITTKFMDSREFYTEGKRLERLINLLKEADATSYLSGPAAKSYIESDRFKEEGIELIYKDYSNYKEYDQFHPPFDHYVTILDLLFHTGEDAPELIFNKQSN
ncbi:WbqC family protein [Paenibacillaceae sp. P-4]|uniref:WbqC family protein n=1 Tax=Paenibacillaceae bacterium P-4 TaxID=3160969 RepID=UPI0032E82B4C